MDEVSRYEWVYIGSSIITSVLVMLVLGLTAARLQKVPGRMQSGVELIVEWLRDTFMSALGPGNERHLPLIFTLFFFILFGNFLEFIPGFRSPTSATNVTMALGLIVFFYVQFVGIRANGIVGYLKHFAGPILLMAPLFFLIELVSEISKPFSLGMRLFGNIFGEDQIYQQISMVQGHNAILHILPLQLPWMLFQAFTDIVQAFIFALLTCSYIALMSVHHDDDLPAHEAPAH